MRLIVHLRDRIEVEEILADAIEAEKSGFDGVALSDARWSPTVLAGALSTGLSGARLLLRCEVGAENPLYLVEEALVAENLLGGRLTLALRAARGFEERFTEAVELVSLALRDRPFRSDGQLWPTPAGLTANRHNLEERVRVGPASVQERIPVWLTGERWASLAARLGCGLILGSRESDQPCGHLALEIGAEELEKVASVPDALRAFGDGSGPDSLIFNSSPDPQRGVSAAQVHSLIDLRAKMQMFQLPPGLAEHWAESDGDPIKGSERG